MGEVGVICFFCCSLFGSFVFQAVGLFTPNWASNSTCSSIGLVYSCCTGDDGDDGETCVNGRGDGFDVRVLGLQATSFAIMCLAVTGLCCILNSSNDGAGLWAALGGCCFMLFPVAGLFSIIGCIIVATKFSTSDLGYSFILCLMSGCFVVLATVVACMCLCKAMKDDDTPPSTPRPTVSHTAQSGALFPNRGDNQVTPSSGEGGHAIQHASMEQVVAVHDQESGSIMVFMRKINITRIIGQFSHSDD